MTQIPIIIDSGSIIKDKYNKNLIRRYVWSAPKTNKNRNQDLTSSHTSIVAKSFTQLSYKCFIVTTNISNQALEEIFSLFLKNDVQNSIYCPFGINTVSEKLNHLLDRFPPGQVICSFPNHGQYHLTGLVVHNNTTVVASNKNKNILRKLSKYGISNVHLIRSKKDNSCLLADYHFLKDKYCNNKGTWCMPKRLFENSGKYNVRPNELFAYQLFEGIEIPLIQTNTLPNGVFFEDGFIYGKTDESFAVSLHYEDTDYTLSFELSEEEIMESFSIFNDPQTWNTASGGDTNIRYKSGGCRLTFGFP